MRWIHYSGGPDANEILEIKNSWIWSFASRSLVVHSTSPASSAKAVRRRCPSIRPSVCHSVCLSVMDWSTTSMVYVRRWYSDAGILRTTAWHWRQATMRTIALTTEGKRPHTDAVKVSLNWNSRFRVQRSQNIACRRYYKHGNYSIRPMRELFLFCFEFRSVVLKKNWKMDTQWKYSEYYCTRCDIHCVSKNARTSKRYSSQW